METVDEYVACDMRIAWWLTQGRTDTVCILWSSVMFLEVTGWPLALLRRKGGPYIPRYRLNIGIHWLIDMYRQSTVQVALVELQPWPVDSLDSPCNVLITRR